MPLPYDMELDDEAVEAWAAQAGLDISSLDTDARKRAAASLLELAAKRKKQG